MALPRGVGFVTRVFVGQAEGGERRRVREALHHRVHEARVAQVGQPGAHLVLGSRVQRRMWRLGFRV